uniref:Uncharacterized protein n=1 Tax=Ditylenchus dipsaci TaxID=166011 RepID=A0A915CNI6_9BILA
MQAVELCFHLPKLISQQILPLFRSISWGRKLVASNIGRFAYPESPKIIPVICRDSNASNATVAENETIMCAPWPFGYNIGKLFLVVYDSLHVN